MCWWGRKMGLRDIRYCVLLLLWMLLQYPTGLLGLPPTGLDPPPSNVTLQGKSMVWNTSSSEGSNTVLLSENGNFSFNVAFTDQSEASSCVAVVQHVQSQLELWVTNFNGSSYQTLTSANTTDQKCTLEFNATGNLVLSVTSSLPHMVWSSNTNGNGMYLQLDNSGNLIIKSRNLGLVWQSFNQPTDTLITGQRLMKGSTLYAALEDKSYSSGGLYFIKPRFDLGLFLDANYVPGDTAQGSFSYWSYILNTNEAASYLSLKNGLTVFNASDQPLYHVSNVLGVQGIEHLEYARLLADGNLQSYIFVNGLWKSTFEALSLCSPPGICGLYGICSVVAGPGGTPEANCTSCAPGFVSTTSSMTQGCKRKVPLPDCKMYPDGYDFVTLSGRTYFIGDITDPYLVQNLSSQDCENHCHVNCSCNAAIYETNTGNCFTNTEFLQSIPVIPGNNTQTIFLRVTKGSAGKSDISPAPAPSIESTKESTRREKANIFAGAAGGVVFVLLAASAWFLYSSRLKLFEAADDGAFVATVDSPKLRPKLPPKFSYSQLVNYTNNFSRKLGFGGFSCVYEGLLSNETTVAVKKLDDGRKQSARDQFLVAVGTLGSIAHGNLVPLRGFCMEAEHKLLVYEFVHGGSSLDRFLFNERDVAHSIDAKARQRIALGIARGLTHLHENCGAGSVLHANLKPENIILDRKMHPHLIDFGLANLISRDQRVMVATMRGARGYMAPEWGSNKPITEKVDVYSFGVVLLELVSGRRCLKQGANEEMCFLPTWGFSLLHQGDQNRVLELVDPLMDLRSLAESDRQVLKGMIFVALWCVQEDASLRPTMKIVVKMLEGDVPVHMPPISHSLMTYAKDLSAGYVGSRAELESSNNPFLQYSTSFVSTQTTSKNADIRPR